ncbi:hypothetical protein [Stutzerimonas frequens]|uniref:hypothetical protein n=1 Tax=Stutzerimonas frequens TaxID=2968969 RepID=UPI001E35CD0F|nr:hypothetical protein [Stutzerimonas frequens]
MHRIGEADEHDLHWIAHVDEQQLRFVLLNAVIDGLSGNTEIIGTGDKGAEAQRLSALASRKRFMGFSFINSFGEGGAVDRQVMRSKYLKS